MSPFLAQDTDFSPWYFKLPTLLTRYIEHRLERSPDTDLFVVLELPDAPLPGVSGRTPVVGFDFEGDSNSYRSTDGGVMFQKDDFGLDWFFDLVSTP